MMIKVPVSEVFSERYGPKGVFTGAFAFAFFWVEAKGAFKLTFSFRCVRRLVSMFMQRCTLKRQQCGLSVDCSHYDTLSLSSSSSSSSSSSDEQGAAPTVKKHYFHNTQDWDDYDCHYECLPDHTPECVSASSTSYIPSKSTTNFFITTTTKFFSANPNSHAVVFDCSHAPSPFLIASYLILVTKLPVSEAVENVGFCYNDGDASEEKAIGIYDRAFLEELQQRYKGENLIPLPVRPSWVPALPPDAGSGSEQGPVKPYEPSSGGFAMPAPRVPQTAKRAGEIAASNQLRRDEQGGKRIKSESMMVIVEPNGRTWKRVTTVVRELCEAASKVKGTAEDDNYDAASCAFPGQSTHTLTRSNLSEITDRYVVTWKALGRRCLMLIINDGVFLLESPSGTIYFCPKMCFPKASSLKANQHRTLLDGILVEDLDPATSSSCKRFLIFDIISHEGSIIGWKKFSIRQQCIIQGVIKPRKQAEALCERDYSRECFKIRRKDFFELDKTRYLTENFIPTLTHSAGGLIFVPKDGKYVVGREGGAGRRNLSWIDDDVAKGTGEAARVGKGELLSALEQSGGKEGSSADVSSAEKQQTHKGSSADVSSAEKQQTNKGGTNNR